MAILNLVQDIHGDGLHVITSLPDSFLSQEKDPTYCTSSWVWSHGTQILGGNKQIIKCC